MTSDAELRTSLASGSDDRGYTLLEAGSLDEAVALLRGHPYFSGRGALQVNESVRVGP